MVNITAAPALAGAAPESAAGGATPPGATPPKAADAGRTVTIAATDAMRFDPSTIAAKPGEKLHVVLKATGVMPKIAMAHNFVILKPGSDAAAFVNASAMARPDFIAPALKAQVLVSTTLAGAGETVTADVVAPVKPGQYPFICTFPGHFNGGMKGVLVVK
jgi:azurin